MLKIHKTAARRSNSVVRRLALADPEGLHLRQASRISSGRYWAATSTLLVTECHAHGIPRTAPHVPALRRMLSSSTRRFPFRGLERFFAANDDASVKVVLTVRLRGDVETLLRFLPTALMNAFNRHPRMRAKQNKDEPLTSTVFPSLTLDDIFREQLLRVREFGHTDSDAEAWANWAKTLEDECASNFDRFNEFPYYATFWADKAASRARLTLVADHVHSDGGGGMAMINGILEDVALLSREQPQEVQELPLRPSLYEMLTADSFWLKPVAKTVVELFGRKLYVGATKGFKSVLTPRSDQADTGGDLPLPDNSARAMFAEGDPGRMRKVLAKCKEESASFGGVLTASMVLAFYHTGKKHQSSQCADDVFKMVAEMCYDMRQRVPKPVPEVQVGLYTHIGALEWLGSEGVNMKETRFWDLGRRATKEMKSIGDQPLKNSLSVFLVDRKLNGKSYSSFLGDHRIPSSVAGDGCISNLGPYPFKREHELANGSVVTVESMHPYGRLPLVGSAAYLWTTAVEAFNYSMSHSVKNDQAQDLFKAYVTIAENVSRIDADATLLKVLEHLDPSSSRSFSSPRISP